MSLSKKNIKILKAALVSEDEKMRRTLGQDVNKLLHPDDADLSEALGGGVDDAQYASQVSLDMSRSIADDNKLTAINDALGRIASNRYGVCEDCEQDIGFERLSVVPWTSRCISCEQKFEDHQDERDATPSL